MKSAKYRLEIALGSNIIYLLTYCFYLLCSGAILLSALCKIIRLHTLNMTGGGCQLISTKLRAETKCFSATVLQTEARKQTDEIWKQHCIRLLSSRCRRMAGVQNHFCSNQRSIFDTKAPILIICSLDLCPLSSVSMNYKIMSDFAPPLQLNAEWHMHSLHTARKGRKVSGSSIVY